MVRRNLSLSSRIFVYMILLVVLASILIAAVTVYQYNEQSQEYHQRRLERKEAQLVSSINYILKASSLEVTPDNLPLIFKDKIYEIANIHNVTFNLFGLNGHLIKTSKPRLENDPVTQQLPQYILDTLSHISSKRYVEKPQLLDDNYRSSYLILNDQLSKPLAILNVPYYDDNSLNSAELMEFLRRLGYAYIVMIFVAIIFAYFMSKYITKSLKAISDKLYKTRLEKRNTKIAIEGIATEIKTLVESYNIMIDDLEESAKKLASSEREQAWREMAKQVAHEIKNPLTPMRLSVQSFQRQFDPSDKEVLKKVDEYSKTLIQQIDTMSKIAEAFSNFAKMPTQNLETINIVEVVERALEIFSTEHLKFNSNASEIYTIADKDQINRVVTNLVKNAIQSVSNEKTPKIEVELKEGPNKVIIIVKDNGVGIEEDLKDKIFQPKFTTKTSGMGLGLPMVKNIIETYKGDIFFETKLGQGTTFTISFPKTQKQ